MLFLATCCTPADTCQSLKYQKHWVTVPVCTSGSFLTATCVSGSSTTEAGHSPQLQELHRLHQALTYVLVKYFSIYQYMAMLHYIEINRWQSPFIQEFHNSWCAVVHGCTSTSLLAVPPAFTCSTQQRLEEFISDPPTTNNKQLAAM